MLNTFSSCPFCNSEVELDKKEITSGQFVCPVCKKIVSEEDLRNVNPENSYLSRSEENIHEIQYPTAAVAPETLIGREASDLGTAEKKSFEMAGIPETPVQVSKPISLFRRFGPMLLFGVVFCLFRIGQSPAPLAIGGLLVGALLFPPGRHYNREIYQHTPWSVSEAFFLFIVSILGQFMGGLIVGFLNPVTHSSMQPPQSISPELTVAVTLISAATAVLAVWIHKLRDGAWWGLGMTAINFRRSIWLGIQAGLAIIGLKLLWFKYCQVFDLWQLSGFGWAQSFFSVESPVWLGVGIFLLSVLIPVSEEILFRGVMFAALRRRSGPVAGALLSSIMFGVCHFPDFFSPTCLGLIFAIMLIWFTQDIKYD